MNIELEQLYQQVILDHNKSPRNFGIIENATNYAVGHNPLCGDHIDIYLVLKDSIIEDIKFNGSGCAISKASASIMTTILKGKTIEETKFIFKNFHELITSDIEKEQEEIQPEKLAVFSGVRQFPSRVKCASLAWHTMNTAIEKNEAEVSTE